VLELVTYLSHSDSFVASLIKMISLHKIDVEVLNPFDSFYFFFIANSRALFATLFSEFTFPKKLFI
jgi:hypothetical protein